MAAPLTEEAFEELFDALVMRDKHAHYMRYWDAISQFERRQARRLYESGQASVIQQLAEQWARYQRNDIGQEEFEGFVAELAEVQP